MAIPDSMRARGWFHLEIFEDGRLIEAVDDHNLIVNGAAAVMASLVGGTFAGNNITQIGYGSGTQSPVAGNTALTTPYYKPFDSITFPAPGTVSFAFSLGTGESNGLLLAEYGLLTANTTLFARKTRAAALQKTAAIALSGSWSIVFQG